MLSVFEIGIRDTTLKRVDGNILKAKTSLSFIIF